MGMMIPNELISSSMKAVDVIMEDLKAGIIEVETLHGCKVCYGSSTFGDVHLFIKRETEKPENGFLLKIRLFLETIKLMVKLTMVWFRNIMRDN